MPEPEQEKKAVAARLGFRKNIFKRFLREVLRLPVRYTQEPGYEISEIPTYKILNEELPFDKILELNNALIIAEQEWDGGKGTLYEKNNSGTLRDEVFELYKRLGSFTNFEALEREGRFAQEGTKDYQTEDLEITLYGDKTPLRKFNFSAPSIKKIRYPDGREYGVAFFGAENVDYFGDLETTGIITREINTILENVKNGMIARQPDKRVHIEENIDNIRKKIFGILSRIKTHLIDFEDRHRSYLIGSGGFIKEKEEYDKLKGSVDRFVLTEDKVVFKHTYLVIRPKIYDASGRLLKELTGFRQTDKEMEAGVEPGYDENGMPLEVTDNGYKFGGSTYSKGYVLIDLFEGITPRKVDDDFITEVDLLDKAAWVHVNYDAYRDDMRDGRYHAHADGACITIMERIMTKLTLPYIKHPQSWKDIKGGKNAKVQINLNQPYRGISKINNTIKPSHLNPAFDLKVKDKDKHLGRKYYYDNQDHMGQSQNRTITTRGAALNILARVIEEVKYWEEAIKLLDSIGKNTGGFDIGPNLGPEFVRWGQPLTRNPFRPV